MVRSNSGLGAWLASQSFGPSAFVANDHPGLGMSMLEKILSSLWTLLWVLLSVLGAGWVLGKVIFVPLL